MGIGMESTLLDGAVTFCALSVYRSGLSIAGLRSSG